jgi:hypothetical protein
MAVVAFVVGPTYVGLPFLLPSSGSGLGPGIAVLGVLLFNDRAVLRKSRADRVLIYEVQASGKSSGRRDLDEVALERLAASVRILGKRSPWVLLTLLVVSCGTVPVIAAVVLSPWWLLACVPGCVVIWLHGSRPKLDPRARIASLTADMAPPIPQ